MKLKTLLAAALAVAVSYAAQATAWFDAGISTYTAWPVGPISEAGSWSDGMAGVAALCGEENAKYLQLTNSAAELSFTALTAIDSTAVLPTATASVKFTPYDFDGLPDVPENAKGAVIVVQEDDESYSYRVLKANAARTANEWSTAITTVSPDLDHAVAVSISYSSVGSLATATYKIGSTQIASMPICVTTAPTASVMAFKGLGEVASLVGTTENFGKLTINPAPFLTVSAVKVGETAITANPDGTYTIPGAQTVTVEYAPNGARGVSGPQSVDFDGTDKTVDPTSTPVFFDGEGTSGEPYQIANADDFFYLATVVASNLAGYVTANYQMTADINWPSGKPFPGIGVFKEGESAFSPATPAFEGVLDGNNKKITNLLLANDGNAYGLFNAVRDATIKDMTIDTVRYDGPITQSKRGGGMFVAIAVGSEAPVLFENLTATGSFGANADGSRLSYNAAGIAYRIETKTAVTFTNCTVSADLYGAYSKLGGFTAIIESSYTYSFNLGTVTYDDCEFSGSVNAVGDGLGTGGADSVSEKVPGCDGVGGFIGYQQSKSATPKNPGNPIVFKNCRMTGTLAGNSANSGSFIGKIRDCVDVTATDCSAPANLKAIGVLHQSPTDSPATGLEYATVENGVATFCAVPDEAEGEFKVMRDITIAPSFVLAGEAEASDVLVFDTTLATFKAAPTVTATPGSHLVAMKDSESYSYSLEFETVEFSVELPDGVLISKIEGVVDDEAERTVNPFHAKWNSKISVTYDAGEGYVFAGMTEPARYYKANGVLVSAIVGGVIPADDIVTSRQPLPSDYSFTVKWAVGDYETLTLTVGEGEAIDLTKETSPYAGKAAQGAQIVIVATTEKVAKIGGAGTFELNEDGKAFTVTYMTDAPIIPPEADVNAVKAAYGITNVQIDDAGTLTKVIGWAGAKGVSKATVNALDFTAASLSDAVKAYLFNVDPANAEAIAAEAAKLNITAITFDENGLPVITDGANGGEGWNGTYKVQGKAALEATSWTDVDGSTAGFNFFRTIIRK